MEESPNDSSAVLPASREESGGGCGGKACLFSCLGIIIVGAGLMVALFFAGRAYLDRQLPVWKQQYPELELVLNSLEHLQSLREHAGEIREMASRMSGFDEVNPASIPGDIPHFDDPLDESFQIRNGTVLIYQRLAMPADVVASRMEQDFQSSGWSPRSDNTASQQHWQKGGASCEVDIDEVPGESELRMVCERPI